MPNTTQTLRNDQEALKASADIQHDTKNALSRLQRNLTETEQAGAMTLEDLYAQRRQLDGIDKEGDRLHDQLDQTDYLQSKLGSWFGGKRKKKHQKAAVVVEEKENDESQSDKKKNPSNSNKWSFRKSSSSKKKQPEFPAYLLDREQALYQGEHKEEMDELADGDKEIDAQMDQVASQLNSILQMAEQIGSETKHQGRQLGAIDQSMGEAQERQKKVHKRIRKHLR